MCRRPYATAFSPYDLSEAPGQLAGCLVIAHYAIRFLIHEAALQTHLDPDRLSFVCALRVIQNVVPESHLLFRVGEKWVRSRRFSAPRAD